MTPDEILRENRRRAQAHAQEVGVARLRKLLEAAQADLNDRITRAEGLRGAGRDSFTAVRARMVLAQVKDVIRNLTGSMRDLVVEQAVDASEAQTASVLHYLAEGERLFAGSAQPLGISQAAMLDHVRQGAESSALRRIVSDPSHRGHRGVLDRYGENVIGKFEDALQQRALTGKPWADVREDLVKESPFLQRAPAHWAERIVRTESMAASNRASQEAMTNANDQLGGGMLKILCAAFDARTSSDSYALHGQIRRVSEPFNDWTHAYMAPPNRPNDRETVVPHRIHWPVPITLKPKSDSEVAARWSAEGRKGSPPARPLMSTVDIAAEKAQVAQENAGTNVQAAPPPVAPPQPPRAPAAPPVPKRVGVFEPTVEERVAPDGGRTFERGGREVPVDGVVRRALDLLEAAKGLRGGVSAGALLTRGVPQVDAGEPFVAAVEKLGGARAVKRDSIKATVAWDDLEHVALPSAQLDESRTARFLAALPKAAPAVVKYGGKYYVRDPELLLAKRLHREASGGPLGHVEVALLDLDKLAPQAPRPTEPWAAEAKHTAERWLAGDATAGGVVRDLIRERLAAIGAVTRDDDVTKSGVVKFGSDRSEAALSAVPELQFNPGANGLHDWQGRTFLRKEDIADSLPVAFLAVSDLATFRAQPVHVQQAVMQVIRVVVHEELHGASAAQSTAYQGPGVGMEEAATEILARKVVREMCGYTDRTGADVPLSLPVRHASGNYVSQPHGGSYEKFIRRTLQAVGDAVGHADVYDRVEGALIKTRQYHREKWTTGAQQIEAFVDALGVTGSAKASLRSRLATDLR